MLGRGWTVLLQQRLRRHSHRKAWAELQVRSDQLLIKIGMIGRERLASAFSRNTKLQRPRCVLCWRRRSVPQLMKRATIVAALCLVLSACVSPYFAAQLGRMGGSVFVMWVVVGSHLCWRLRVDGGH